MKKQDGVTLASLTIYVIVAGIIIVMLSLLNLNFFSRMTELTNQTYLTTQYSNFCSSFLRDVKGSDSVIEYNENQLKFSNGAKYEIKKASSEDKYAIYKDNIKVCENVVSSPSFDYDYLSNTVTVKLTFSKPNVSSYSFSTNQFFKVGY